MPVNSRGQKYTISDNGKNRLHVYGTKGKPGYRVVRMARPKGYLYNPKNTQYYRIKDNGLSRQHVYQSGRKVDMGAGSYFKKAGIPGSFYQQALNTWNITNKPTIDALTRNKDRERGAQNAAYGQIAGYYAGLSGNARNLMAETGRIGGQTDQQLQQIGADRNTQIQAAKPQYQGPLGEIAQRMADSETQSALGRGANIDSANRGFNANVSGSRQALLGNMGAAQQIAGQERLSTLKGQGNQALLAYTDKINDIEAQKPAKILDTARQLQYDNQALGLKMADLQQQAADDAAKNKIAQQNADANMIGATKPPTPKTTKPKDGSSWYDGVDKGVSLARQLASVNLGKGHTPANSPERLRNVFRDLINSGKISRDQAIVAWSLMNGNGGLSAEAVRIIHQRGFRVGSRYKVDRSANVRRPFPL